MAASKMNVKGIEILTTDAQGRVIVAFSEEGIKLLELAAAVAKISAPHVKNAKQRIALRRIDGELSDLNNALRAETSREVKAVRAAARLGALWRGPAGSIR